MQCRAFLDPEDIFKCEVEETHDKLLSALMGLDTFKETYEDHRRRLPEYRSNSSIGNSDASLEDWEFPPQIIFHRYDRFLARLANIRVRIGLIDLNQKNSTEGLLIILVTPQHFCAGTSRIFAWII